MNVKNRSRTTFVLQLLHHTTVDHPASKHTELSVEMPEHQEDGTVGHRLVEKTLPGSVTWLPGEMKEGLPDHLRQIPQFQSALESGTLQVVAS